MSNGVFKFKAGASVVGVIILIVLLINTFSWTKVEGSEAVVLQHLTKGVVEDTVWKSGTHFYLGWLFDTYKYDIGTQKITFDSQQRNKDAEYNRIKVNCGDGGGQSAWITVSANYRIGWIEKDGSPTFSKDKLISLHKDGLRTTYESVVLKRTIIDVVNKIARPKMALDIYSGQGFVDFKDAVDSELRNHPVFKERGIYIENVIVYNVELEPNYEKEIEAKQLAIQTTLRKKEETKAAQEEARRAFAEAQAEVERVTQTAEGKKIQRIKEAEAEKAEIELQASAEKSKRVLEAEGERDANLALASGIIAVGEATAKSEALLRDALYAGEAGQRRASVKIATAQAEKLKGIFEGVNIVPERTIAMFGNDAMPTIAIDE